MAGGAALAVAAVALAWLPGPREARSEAVGRTVVRVGLINTLFRGVPESMIDVVARPFQKLLESQTGVNGQLVIGGDSDSLRRKLLEDEVQIGVFHGIEFAWARLKAPALKPLLIAVNRQPFLRAHLVVRRDSLAAGPGDLKGTTLALPNCSREHCRLFLERRCVPSGCTPGEFFTAVTTPSDTDDALDQVVEKQAQAAVVDAVDLAAYQRRKPGRASCLRTLQESESFPCAVVVYKPGVLDEGLVRQFCAGMLAAKSNPQGQELLKLCKITGFEPVPADYERLLADIVRAYPPPAAPR
jgi:ABC-type phosphate/phosphonate transport system substrate-binding protein